MWDKRIKRQLVDCSICGANAVDGWKFQVSFEEMPIDMPEEEIPLDAMDGKEFLTGYICVKCRKALVDYLFRSLNERVEL